MSIWWTCEYDLTFSCKNIFVPLKSMPSSRCLFIETWNFQRNFQQFAISSNWAVTFIKYKWTTISKPCHEFLQAPFLAGAQMLCCVSVSLYLPCTPRKTFVPLFFPFLHFDCNQLAPSAAMPQLWRDRPHAQSTQQKRGICRDHNVTPTQANTPCKYTGNRKRRNERSTSRSQLPNVAALATTGKGNKFLLQKKQTTFLRWGQLK